MASAHLTLPGLLSLPLTYQEERNKAFLVLVSYHPENDSWHLSFPSSFTKHPSQVFLRTGTFKFIFMHSVIFLPAVLEGKRKRASHSADSSLNSHDSSPHFSSVESASEFDEKQRHHKPKRHSKSKRSKKKRRQSKKEKDADTLPSKQR